MSERPITTDAAALSATEAEQLARWLRSPLFGGPQSDITWSREYGISFVQWDPNTGAIAPLPMQ